MWFHAQQLQEQTRKREEVWESVKESYQSLVKTVDQGTAQLLAEQMEEEQKRFEAWNDQTHFLYLNPDHLLFRCQ